MDFTKKSDNELMSEFSSCSFKAYEEIVNRYKKKLYNYLLKGLLKDKDVAEDIVQDTFLRVYEYKIKYKPSYQFSTWIFRICRNLALNKIRDNKKFSRMNDVFFDEEPAGNEENLGNSLENGELTNILNKIINELDDIYREAVTLRYMENLSYKEISEITGKNENTLKSLCKRGLEKIKKRIGDKTNCLRIILYLKRILKEIALI